MWYDSKTSKARKDNRLKVIDIVGENYIGKWDKTRTACRGIIIEGDKILLSYEIVNDQWMIPGGGLEDNETDKECCMREIAEETGMVVDVSECMLEIDEYYENWKWVNKYFICKVTGTTEKKLTQSEQEAGMISKWLPVDEIKGIFSKYNTYAGIDEMRRGMYLREYTALTELI